MMVDDPEQHSRPVDPEAEWHRASRRLHSLQRVQLMSLVTIGVIAVVATMAAGVTFARTTDRLESRERARAELTAFREEARSLQVELFKRTASGDLALSAPDILRISSLFARTQRRAAGPPPGGETDAEHDARRTVATSVENMAETIATADIADLERQMVDGGLGDFMEQQFAAFNVWVDANDRAVSEERRSQQQLITYSGLGIGAMVVVLTGLGLGVWWRTERARARVIDGARAQSRRYDSLVSNASDIVIIVDASGRVDFCSPSVDRVLGMSPEVVVGTPFVDLVHPDDAALLDVMSPVRLADGEVGELIDLRLRRVDGGWTDVETLIGNLLADPAVHGFVLNCRDISDRKEVEARLVHQAFHDALTGLPNRTWFENSLRDALDADVDAREPIAVFVLDLDDFKTVNDTLGHQAGDEMLNVVGERLRRCVRPGDSAARLGGDEFGVIVRGLAGTAALRAIAERIAEAVREPMTLAGRELRVSSSVGIAIAPRSGSDYHTITKHADIAMYAAKATGGVRVAVFAPEMELAFDERMRLGLDLDRAVVAGDQFRVVYQPIVDLETEAIIGAEALVRWQHPTEGTVSPDRFIPLAEANGLILEIGEFVLRTACSQCMAWTAATGRDLAINVNVSPRQLEDPDFAAVVDDALRSSGLAAELLTIEITESVIGGDVETVVELLERVRALGVRVAIDDFGTGYSSLSQLRRLPVDMVKIDKEFIDDLARGGGDGQVTGLIMQLGSVLDLTTVAEGIEEEGQVAVLRRLHCDAGQGYLFARPMPADGMAALLEGETPVPGAGPGAPVAPSPRP